MEPWQFLVLLTAIYLAPTLSNDQATVLAGLAALAAVWVYL